MRNRPFFPPPKANSTQISNLPTTCPQLPCILLPNALQNPWITQYIAAFLIVPYITYRSHITPDERWISQGFLQLAFGAIGATFFTLASKDVIEDPSSGIWLVAPVVTVMFVLYVVIGDSPYLRWLESSFCRGWEREGKDKAWGIWTGKGKG